MNRLEKIVSAVGKDVTVYELEMLDYGCLSHIGDVIEAGAKDILIDGTMRAIKDITSYYREGKCEAIPKTITVSGVELVPPVTKIEEDKKYWLCNIIEHDYPIYTSEDTNSLIHSQMEKKFIFATKNDAALYTKHVLLAAHKKLIESGEI